MKGKITSGLMLLKALLTIMVCLGTVLPPPAQAAESGMGVYVLGYQSSMAGFLPPPGAYLRNDFYVFQGITDKIPLTKNIEVNLRGRSIMNIVSGAVVTPWKILGANYGFGVIWAVVGNTFIKGQVDIANRLSIVREGDRTDFSDLVLTPIMLGWHLDKFHIMFVGNVYAPIGTYNSERILNTSLNRWAVEPNLAVTWLHPKYGMEVSAQLGYTINFQNPATKYTTGHELHLEWFAGQHFTKWFAVGLAGYFYQQVTGDSGKGARLGEFKGQVLSLGPCISFNGKIGQRPLGVNLRYYFDVTTTNRLNGQSLFATVSFGLKKMAQ